jgi:hypothetical protein
MFHLKGDTLVVLTNVDSIDEAIRSALAVRESDAELDAGRDGLGVEGGGGISVLRTRVAFLLGFGAIRVRVERKDRKKYDYLPFWFSDM